MNHDRAFARTMLQNLALLFERGQCDRDFADLGIDISEMRASLAEGIREIADAVEGAAA